MELIQIIYEVRVAGIASGLTFKDVALVVSNWLSSLGIALPESVERRMVKLSRVASLLSNLFELP